MFAAAAEVFTVSENNAAASTGDRRKALEELRDTLASALDAAALKGDGTVAQLAAQYRATLADIAALPAAEKGPVSKVDELADRRASRVAGPGDSVPAKRRGKQRGG